METIYQLAYWVDYETACTIYLDEDRTPTNQELLDACGETLYQIWMNTPICNRNQMDSNGATGCEGLFLRRAGQREKNLSYEDITVLQQNLDQVRFTIENVNCSSGEVCSEKPELLIRASMPDDVPDVVHEIRVRVEGFEGSCNGSVCQMRLPLTGEKGTWFEYWGLSKNGLQSEHKWLKFRVLEKPVAGQTYYDYQIAGNGLPNTGPYGSEIWYTFPSIYNELPAVLERVPTYEYLVTKHKLSILTSKLLRSGIVDASSCPHYGLNEDGTANGCGEELAASMVFQYQNQYDEAIFNAGKRYNVPPRIIKGLIAQESQFWPYSDTQYEYGLGMMTEAGADMLLRWNTNYFLQLCFEVFPWDRDKCYKGFSELPEDDQIALRGSALKKVNTKEEVDLLAATIRASMLQVNQVVNNATGLLPSDVTTYEDMWKFTMANYYSGSGCLYNAITQTNSYGMPVVWDNVRNFMTGECAKAGQYVDRVYELGN